MNLDSRGAGRTLLAEGDRPLNQLIACVLSRAKEPAHFHRCNIVKTRVFDAPRAVVSLPASPHNAISDCKSKIGSQGLNPL